MSNATVPLHPVEGSMERTCPLMTGENEKPDLVVVTEDNVFELERREVENWLNIPSSDDKRYRSVLRKHQLRTATQVELITEIQEQHMSADIEADAVIRENIAKLYAGNLLALDDHALKISKEFDLLKSEARDKVKRFAFEWFSLTYTEPAADEERKPLVPIHQCKDYVNAMLEDALAETISTDSDTVSPDTPVSEVPVTLGVPSSRVTNIRTRTGERREHKSQPTDHIHTAMLASIGRTAFIGDPMIAPISSVALQEGNRRVLAKYGENARRLLIVGNDAVMIDKPEAVVIKGVRAAELLGLIIFKRAITVRSSYFDAGFFANAISDGARGQAATKATNDLDEILRDSNGQSLITHTGNRASSKYGMDDVLVRDIRHTKGYKQAREQQMSGVVEEFIVNGGRIPLLIESEAMHGARAAMRKLAREEVKGEEILARFALMNKQISAMLEHRTDQYNEARILFNRSTEMRSYISHILVDELEGSWQQKGACKGGKSTVFFSPPGEKKKKRIVREDHAKTICSQCPVKEPCLEQALSRNEQQDDIWGGHTKSEREEMIKERKAAAEAAKKAAEEAEKAQALESQTTVSPS